MDYLHRGGGAYCGDFATGLPPKPITCQVPDGPNGAYVNGTCFGPSIIPLCSGNGHVMLPFGAPEYIGRISTFRSLSSLY